MSLKMKLLQRTPDSVLRAVGPKLLTVQKHSPTILFGAGVVGAVATTVMACRATLKLEDILLDAEKTKMQIDTVLAGEDTPAYTDKDRQKDQIILKVQTAKKITRLYAPAIGLGIVSIGALTGSHYIMSSRQAGLFAAYAALEKGYDELYARVRDEYGDEKAEQLKHGAITVKGKDADGKVTKTIVKDPSSSAVYTRLFSEDTATEWQKTPEYNYMSLQVKQSYATNLLKAKGYLFLNDVMEMLGMQRTPAGQLVGWISDGPKSDGFVDFGIFNNDPTSIRDFMAGDEGAIWLEFNCDGNILNLI